MILQTEEEEMIMDVMEAIKERRSIRKYKSDPVPEEALRTILEAVRWAPSWANTQCWEIVVVRDSAMKSKLAEAIPQANPVNAAVLQAPVAIVVCGKKGVSGWYGGKISTDKGDWYMYDAGLATQNLCLAAHSLGLGTVIGGLFDHKKAGEVLGLPQDVEVVAIVPLGYPAAARGSSKRKDSSEFVSYDRFGNRKP
jgi:nitroreductase